MIFGRRFRLWLIGFVFIGGTNLSTRNAKGESLLHLEMRKMNGGCGGLSFFSTIRVNLVVLIRNLNVTPRIVWTKAGFTGVVTAFETTLLGVSGAFDHLNPRPRSLTLCSGSVYTTVLGQYVIGGCMVASGIHGTKINMHASLMERVDRVANGVS